MEVQNQYLGSNTIIQLCLIVGPLDRTDRFTYWPARIDNAIGPDKPLTIAGMLYGVKAVTTAGAQFTWVPRQFLQAQGIRPWSFTR